MALAPVSSPFRATRGSSGTLRTVITPLGGARQRLLQARVRADFTLYGELRKLAAAAGIRIEGMAKARAPRMTGRLATSIYSTFLPSPQIGVAIGTNVRSAPSAKYPQGYRYPARQEFDETLKHSPPITIRIAYTRTKATKTAKVGDTAYRTLTGRRGGQARYLRDSLAIEAGRFGQACRRALEDSVRRLSGGR